MSWSGKVADVIGSPKDHRLLASKKGHLGDWNERTIEHLDMMKKGLRAHMNDPRKRTGMIMGGDRAYQAITRKG